MTGSDEDVLNECERATTHHERAKESPVRFTLQIKADGKRAIVGTK